MVVIRELFGSHTDALTGETCPVYRYKLSCKDSIEVHLLSYGAGICGIIVPDKLGNRDNVVLGFDSLEGYLAHNFHGSSVGRVANRIAGGKFSLRGQTHQLTLNNNGNSLHGGVRGWDKRVWSGSEEGDAVVFSLVSADGDQGYPGTVMAQVHYSLSGAGRLQVQYRALTSAATPINMTNHAFFNLAGHDSGREGLIGHHVQLHCNAYLPVDEKLIPTGEQRPVADTPFDLSTSETDIGTALDKVGPDGFDHCFVLANSDRGQLRKAARFSHPSSGRTLEVFTTEPAVQLYTGNFLPPVGEGLKGRGGASYTRQGAFCCEAQNLPDAVNQPNFPDSILKPGDVYNHTLVYDFRTQ